MSTAVKEGRAPREEDERAGHLFDPGGARSLENVLLAVSESLTVRGNAHCVVCGGTLIREAGEQAAECSACGSRLE